MDLNNESAWVRAIWEYCDGGELGLEVGPGSTVGFTLVLGCELGNVDGTSNRSTSEGAPLVLGSFEGWADADGTELGIEDGWLLGSEDSDGADDVDGTELGAEESEGDRLVLGAYVVCILGTCDTDGWSVGSELGEPVGAYVLGNPPCGQSRRAMKWDTNQLWFQWVLHCTLEAI